MNHNNYNIITNKNEEIKSIRKLVLKEEITH